MTRSRLARRLATKARAATGPPAGRASPTRRDAAAPQSQPGGSRRMAIEPAARREAAREAGLRWSTDAARGSGAARAGRGFSYRDPDGDRDPRPRDARPDPVARRPAGLDATSGSARTRAATSRRPAATPAAASSTATTRRYRASREQAKYERHARASRALLPRIRERVDEDLALAGPAAREGARGGRAAAGADAHPRRQRRVRAAQPVVRPHDAAGPPRHACTANGSGSASAARAACCTTSTLRDRRLARVVGAVPGPARART